MSMDLYWRANVPQAHHILPRALKYILARTYFDHDGSLSGVTVIGDNDVQYLKGVAAGTNEQTIRDGIETLISAIERYGSVILEIAE